MPKPCQLHFTKPGLLTTIQDHGRLGKQSSGVPVGGAMDGSSMRIANWLVGNDWNTPVLESTIIGPTIEFDRPCQIAITGADMKARINGSEIPRYETINVKSGSTLVFGSAITGKRTYLAVGGSWQIQTWLGSCSTASYRSEDITPQSTIHKGSTINIEPVKTTKHRSFDINLRPTFFNEATIGVVPGPEYHTFDADLRNQFWKQNFSIGQDSNRMGYRLTPPLADYSLFGELISSAVLPGTVQITNEGKPIVLMADAQTTGGYPRMAHVISAHLDILGQLAGGDHIKFREYSLREAQQALIDQKTSLKITLES